MASWPLRGAAVAYDTNYKSTGNCMTRAVVVCPQNLHIPISNNWQRCTLPPAVHAACWIHLSYSISLLYCRDVYNSIFPQCSPTGLCVCERFLHGAPKSSLMLTTHQWFKINVVKLCLSIEFYINFNLQSFVWVWLIGSRLHYPKCKLHLTIFLVFSWN